MKRSVSVTCIVVFLALFLSLPGHGAENGTNTDELNISGRTQRCIGCHENATPGVVEDWRASLHSKTTPHMALQKDKLQRRMSADKVNENLLNHVVGCYECHGLNVEKHQDSFNHFGLKINVVVSPKDCSACHPVEEKEYMPSKKGFAYGNLKENSVYHALVKTVISAKKIQDGKVVPLDASAFTEMDTCFGCHGTDVKVNGVKKVSSGPLKITVPNLTNWPNQGVGRLNPDGSRGCCSSCHPRHSFSIDIARKPYTCAQCHLEPDVPAWNVYKESKHANIYISKEKYWEFNAVPWVLGEDFKAPTCAACHNSLVTTPKNKVILERTHDFGARLWVRIFGLIYSHPQPRTGDTYIIKNRDGLPLPTDFTGNWAKEYLIDEKEQESRKQAMMNVCIACHSTSWVDGHFAKLDSTIKETDQMVLGATSLMSDAWGKNLADNQNPFDETIEHLWVAQWLFYANSIRYASAMTGAPDYAAFKNGWWDMTRNLKVMEDWIKLRQ